jgi:hypothetical protein
VGGLLSIHESETEFVSLTEKAAISHYKIIMKLGAGGMGAGITDSPKTEKERSMAK